MSLPDVAVVGGGITGCSAAAFLAEAGARVVLHERAELAAGASGRNSGVLQHPLDEALAGLFADSLDAYRTLGHGFPAPGEPAGVLVLAEDPEPLEAERAGLAARFPELGAEALAPEDVTAVEPAAGPGLHAYRLATGHPVPPAAATHAWAARARAAGAELRTGSPVRPALRDGRAEGVVLADGSLAPAGAVVLAAGPWTPPLLDPGGGWRPVTALWGVVAEVALDAPPRHVTEEAGVEAVSAAGDDLGTFFSLVTADGVSALGSTFLADEPAPEAFVPALLERGRRYVPALAGAQVRGVRACARPASADGRPLLGPLPGVDGLHLLTGHGAWGVTLGPASARLVADAVLGRDAGIAPELAAGRFGAP